MKKILLLLTLSLMFYKFYPHSSPALAKEESVSVKVEAVVVEPAKASTIEVQPASPKPVESRAPATYDPLEALHNPLAREAFTKGPDSLVTCLTQIRYCMSNDYEARSYHVDEGERETECVTKLNLCTDAETVRELISEEESKGFFSLQQEGNEDERQEEPDSEEEFNRTN